MQDDTIGDYHSEYEAKVALIPVHEVKARVKDDGLASDSAVPTNDDQGNVHVDSGWVNPEALEEEANGIRHDSPDSNAETPEVQATTLLKGGKYHEGELDNIVEGNGDECDDDDYVFEIARRLGARAGILGGHKGPDGLIVGGKPR